MANAFERMMSHAFDVMKKVEGESATLYYGDGSGSQAITAIFNEFVGFVDDRRRSVWTFKGVDVTGVAADRGDYFVLSGETDQWSIIDVRDDKAGGVEVRADGALGRL